MRSTSQEWAVDDAWFEVVSVVVTVLHDVEVVDSVDAVVDIAEDSTHWFAHSVPEHVVVNVDFVGSSVERELIAVELVNLTTVETDVHVKTYSPILVFKHPSIEV